VFQVGILACLPSHSPRWEIEGAIKQICERKPYLSSFFGTRLVNGLCGDGSVPVLRNCSHSSALLSAREQDLLYYLSQGFSNKEIAQELHLTEATVRNYISHLYSKLEISHRSEAVAYACTYIAMNTSDTSWSEKKKYIASNTSESQNN
jgi:DNA-binding NarL/FixJ family response regulator